MQSFGIQQLPIQECPPNFGDLYSNRYEEVTREMTDGSRFQREMEKNGNWKMFIRQPIGDRLPKSVENFLNSLMI